MPAERRKSVQYSARIIAGPPEATSRNWLTGGINGLFNAA
jgi:hypothetical protein